MKSDTKEEIFLRSLVHAKIEGSPIHPDDLTWECDLDVCKACRAKYDKQLKAFNAFHGIKEVSE